MHYCTAAVPTAHLISLNLEVYTPDSKLYINVHMIKIQFDTSTDSMDLQQTE